MDLLCCPWPGASPWCPGNIRPHFSNWIQWMRPSGHRCYHRSCLCRVTWEYSSVRLSLLSFNIIIIQSFAELYGLCVVCGQIDSWIDSVGGRATRKSPTSSSAPDENNNNNHRSDGGENLAAFGHVVDESLRSLSVFARPDTWIHKRARKLLANYFPSRSASLTATTTSTTTTAANCIDFK